MKLKQQQPRKAALRLPEEIAQLAQRQMVWYTREDRRDDFLGMGLLRGEYFCYPGILQREAEVS